MAENFEEAKILDEEPDFKDTLENLVASFGNEKDKRALGKFVNNKQLQLTGSREELDALYMTDWLAGKTVDIVPDDMTREWREFDGDIDPDTIKVLKEEEERLDLLGAFNEAHKWGRLYGGGFIVMSIDDGLDPEEPVDLNKVKKGSLKHIKVIDRHRIDYNDQTITDNPLDPNFGRPEHYKLHGTSVRIHNSRLLRFDGVKLPYEKRKQNNFFSDSVLSRLYEAITNFTTAAQGSASMIYETNVDVIKVKGLMNLLSSAEGEAMVRKRFALAKLLKSFNNMMLLDAEESTENKTNTFSGLPDLIDRFAQHLSAATDIPATRLLGVSASGFNATGEGDLKNYYDMIRSKQVTTYKPLLDYFDEIMVRSLGLPEDGDYSYDFVSLFQMTPKEQADVELTQSNTAKNYYDMGVIDELVIAKELMQRGTFTNIDEDFIKEVEQALEEAKKFAEEMRENGIDPDSPTSEDPEQQDPEATEEEDDPAGT